jgi:hypothetical protein
MLGELNIWKIARTDTLKNPYIPQIGALGAEHIIHMWRHTRAMAESLWGVYQDNNGCTREGLSTNPNAGQPCFHFGISAHLLLEIEGHLPGSPKWCKRV